MVYSGRAIERKCTTAGTPCTSGSPTGTRVFIQRRGENTVCTLIAYGGRVRRPFFLSPSPALPSSLSLFLFFARSENGKYENDKLFRLPRARRTVSCVVPSARIRINPLSRLREAPLTHDNAVPTKESNLHLRYYTPTNNSGADLSASRATPSSQRVHPRARLAKNRNSPIRRGATSNPVIGCSRVLPSAR